VVDKDAAEEWLARGRWRTEVRRYEGQVKGNDQEVRQRCREAREKQRQQQRSRRDAGAIDGNGSAQVSPGVESVAVFYPAVADVGAVVHVGDQNIFDTGVHLGLCLLHGLAQADDYQDYSGCAGY
jgi:hypothetical protein